MSKEKKNMFVPDLRFSEFKDSWLYLNGDELFEQISDKDHNSDLPILAVTQEHGTIPRDKIDYNVSVTDKSIESYKVVQVGDFIISLRSFQGGIEYSEYKGLCSPAYIILRKKSERDVVNEFFKHYFKTKAFIRELNKNLEGLRDGKMVSYKQFSDIKNPYPKPEEQQKIASCLSSLDDLITAHAQKLDALKAHKKGLMRQLFPSEEKKVHKLRFEEFMDSGEWKEKTIGEIADVTTGGTPDSSNAKYWNGNIPWMNSGDLNKKRVYSVDNRITELGLKESSTRLIPPYCVLIGLAGQGKTRGTAAINYIELCTNQSVAAIHPNEDEFVSEFLYQWIDSKYDELRALSTGEGGRGGLNLQIIKSFKISLPGKGGKEEQRKIASCLSSLDHLIITQAEKIEQLKMHKKGLVQGLFPKIEESN